MCLDLDFSGDQERFLDGSDNDSDDEFIEIPQIVVCGDTSVGNSSVLEAISCVKFRRGDTICTRYATEYVFRHFFQITMTIIT